MFFATKKFDSMLISCYSSSELLLSIVMPVIDVKVFVCYQSVQMMIFSFSASDSLRRWCKIKNVKQSCKLGYWQCRAVMMGLLDVSCYDDIPSIV